MDKFNDLENWTDKERRRLRMNLNNRLESFKKDGQLKELAKSHMLFGLSRDECESLLLKIKNHGKKTK